MNQPLQGYRILDFTKLLPGPLATLWMAQQGAEVIKVESPFDRNNQSKTSFKWFSRGLLMNRTSIRELPN